MSGYDGRGTQFPLVIPRGADIAFTLTVTDSGGAPVDVSAATIAGELYNAAGGVVDTLSAVVSGAGSNVVTLSLTDTETAALVGVTRWTLWVTRGGDKRPWLAGLVKVVPGSSPTTTTSGNTTLKVDTDVNVAVSVAVVGGSGGGGAVDSVNGQTGVVVLDADDIDDTATTHKFATSAQLDKVDAISTFGASLVDDVDAAAARTTLGLGTAATTDASAYQPADADLTALAGIAGVQGDIIVRGASGWERLPKSSTATDVLTAGASQPAWAAAAAGGAATWFVNLDPVAPTSHTNWSTLDHSSNHYRFLAAQSGGAVGDLLSWTRHLDAGTWTFRLLFTGSTNRPIVDVKIDGSVVGTIDLYTPTTNTRTVADVAGITVTSSGTKTIVLEVTGKNVSSSNFFGLVADANMIRTA
jgi:hypothetical protein